MEYTRERFALEFQKNAEAGVAKAFPTDLSPEALTSTIMDAEILKYIYERNKRVEFLEQLTRELGTEN